MPKAEKGTPKDIANRMKAKGLQKLKYYCQVCSKQCRDENGFKCHLTSDSHLRNMKIFCSNSSGMLDSFSAEFEKTYLDTLYRRHRTKRCNANNIYQEMIQDKHHVHMNATKWTTLTDFVQYLGKAGKCVVEETERGWYVTFIERDPTILAQQENYQRRVESEKREEEKFAKRMELQRVEAAKLMDRAGVGVKVEASKIDRAKSGDAPIALNIGDKVAKKKVTKRGKVGNVFGDDDSDEIENDGGDHGIIEQQREQQRPMHAEVSNGSKIASNAQTPDGSRGSKRKKENIPDEHNVPPDFNKPDGGRDVIKEKARKKRRRDDGDMNVDDDGLKDIRKKNWIRKDILVRIISKKLSKGAYYKRKGIINEIHDKFTAEVEIFDSGPDADDGGDIVKVDQDYLETVVPKEGKKVMILNGRGRGMLAKLISADNNKYRGTLELIEDGIVLKKVDFDDFSKAV
eukprot:CAMPEP_0204641408 /NCGR_PEP_ID=MMETSP0717-20131115/51113_1 /ASSEMBLY_ACC=CAM_ASM_000666 /TAXON_ID=230516 /ORGANISM="Chaetoceros curvisetus" /LENGTH=457 /DNA_ID=CAMNT_0051662069 /DNA_START=413 /DNA_END=1786 /DNA_ORIENTATION=-